MKVIVLAEGDPVFADELAQYNLWLDYLDALDAIDTSKAPDITWPTPPAA